MRKYLSFLILMLLIGCSKDSVKSSSDVGLSNTKDGRYNYFLTEALRQNYVGKGSDAVGLFEKCIEIDPGRSVPYYELAQLYASSGMGSKALQYAQIAARLEKENYWYQMACGSLFTQYNEKDSAIYYFKRALKLKPEEIEVNAILAGLYAERGKVLEADSILLKLSDRDALNEEIFIMMISGLVGNGNFKEAAKRTLFYIERHPSEVKYKTMLADIYIESGLKEKGDSIYNSIIIADPDNVETQLYVLGNMIRNKEYTGVESFLSSIYKSDIIEIEKKKAITHELLQDSIYRSEQVEVLEKNLIILEGINNSDEEILSFRPQLYESIGRQEDAIKRYEEILKSIKPGFYFKERLLILYAEEKDYNSLFNLASSYSKENNRSILGKFYYALASIELKDYNIAEQELKKALVLAGNDDRMKLQVYSMMGDMYYRMKNNEEAYKYFEQALVIDPGEVTILNNYAYYLAEEGKELKKALEMAEKVMETENQNPTYIDTYAWVLFKMDKPKEALREMKRIFEISDENDPELLEHMGYILKALNDCEHAIFYWQRAISLDSSKNYINNDILKCKSGIK